jgi:hypothetical protein
MAVFTFVLLMTIVTLPVLGSISTPLLVLVHCTQNPVAVFARIKIPAVAARSVQEGLKAWRR